MLGPHPWSPATIQAVNTLIAAKQRLLRADDEMLHHLALDRIVVDADGGLAFRPDAITPAWHQETLGVQGCERILRQASPYPWAAQSISRAQRNDNDDGFMAMGNAFAVVNGAGGTYSGALSTHMVLSALEEDGTPTERLRRAERALNHVRGRAGPGSHAEVALVVLDANVAAIAWVGTARVYLYRDLGLTRLTKDHNVANRECATPKQRAMSPEDFDGMIKKWGHLVARAFRPGAEEAIETRDVTVQRGDVLLLTTPGVAGHAALDDETILDVLNAHSTVASWVSALLKAARATGKDWDQTVAIVQV